MRSPRPLLAALAAVLAACATTGEPKPLAVPVTLGIARPIGEDAARSAAAELDAYLAPRLGPGSTVKVYENVAALADALSSGAIDVAWLTPGAYVRARTTSAGVRPVLKLLRGGATSYRSAFFTLRDAGSSLASFRGKRLALVADGSMSGRLYPLAHLKKLGIDAHLYFSQIVDGKDHREVCELVASGRADLGATLSDDHGTIVAEPDGCREAGFDMARFSVVASTGPIPNDVIAVRAGLDDDVVDRLQQLFEAMHADDAGKTALRQVFRADGFAPASDEDFNSLRELESFVDR